MTFPSGNDGRKLTQILWAPILGLPLLLTGCSGASSTAGSVGTSGGPFQLSQISVDDGEVWQINRPITFTFSVAVDFDTVNLNTIQIQQMNGAPAVGEFSMVPGDPRTVSFQPVCPKRDDFLDAGFKPGGVNYRVDVPTTATGATTVRSLSGKALTLGWTRNFVTPVTTVLPELFLDPRPGPPKPVISPGVGTLLRVGSSNPADTFFQINPDGTGSLPPGFLVSNNFYSDTASQVALHVRFDQPVNPRAENINSTRLVMQYFNGVAWVPVSAEVFLEANCVGTGASVRVTPIGILPQGRLMRVVVTPEFEDLVGDRNLSPLDKLMIMTADSVTEGGVPVETADEVLDEYLTNQFEDTAASLTFPAADWGSGGLQAAFAFDGSGGPGGNFDLHIPPNSDVVFNTTSTLFFGGPGGVPQFSQLAVNGRLDVHNLYIPPSSTLRIQGVNPAVIYATGTVTVEGRLSADGGSAAPVFTLNTPFQPESGGAGQAGGGDGGIGSYLTTQVTPRGGNGEGPGGIPNLGGQGGESGYSSITSGNGVSRRAAGGGGGRVGPDHMYSQSAGGGVFVECFEQSIYGLDAESGFVGHDNAKSSQGDHIPYGGMVGPGPFGLVPGTSNDFWGTKIENVGTPQETLVKGELNSPKGGSGGGAGGDATYTPVEGQYPPAGEMVNNHQDKGAGGGGGAGSMTVLALGDIVVSGIGKISAIGGFGSGGENTAGVNRVGGGSGGGSGGHIVLQAAGRIDFSGVSNGIKAIDARGGEGGEGAGGAGGASANELIDITKDAKHIGINNGIDNPWVVIDTACFGALTGSKVVRAAGGDGGPGLVQLHVGDLAADIGYQTTVASLFNAVRPVPHGYSSITKQWKDHLLPIFGRFSMAQSKWIPLGEATVDPVSSMLGPISFLFDGTNPGDGIVENAIYTRNPNLLRNFNLTVGGIPYYVASAKYLSGSDQLALTILSTGPSLAGATGAVELRPRYFAISTSGVLNSLPASSSVTIEFDLRGVNPNNVADTSTTGFVPNLVGENLNALGITAGHTVRFMRYRVTFDITQGVVELGTNTPRPRIEFLLLPFRF